MVLGPSVNKFIPYLSLGIATAAFAFQTTVLYPWHHELDDAFRKLKAEQASALQEFHELKLKRLEALEKKLVGVQLRQD
ncbi:hypothetical protein BDZ89DRAFT_366718 [Hymenopellis radicata]|nr:hypothetical protein BDZ89DRAFT_366718 [Hymenopellis radicata]